jgi:hypothetical protein
MDLPGGGKLPMLSIGSMTVPQVTRRGRGIAFILITEDIVFVICAGKGDRGLLSKAERLVPI